MSKYPFNIYCLCLCVSGNVHLLLSLQLTLIFTVLQLPVVLSVEFPAKEVVQVHDLENKCDIHQCAYTVKVQQLMLKS